MKSAGEHVSESRLDQLLAQTLQMQTLMMAQMQVKRLRV